MLGRGDMRGLSHRTVKTIGFDRALQVAVHSHLQPMQSLLRCTRTWRLCMHGLWSRAAVGLCCVPFDGEESGTVTASLSQPVSQLLGIPGSWEKRVLTGITVRTRLIRQLAATTSDLAVRGSTEPPNRLVTITGLSLCSERRKAEQRI